MTHEMRELISKWRREPQLWAKHLEWVELSNIHGWNKRRIVFDFPLIAIAGENGVGKSTILQAAAGVYSPDNGGRGHFASKFFPDTAWDLIRNANVNYRVREGDSFTEGTVQKLTNRWRNKPDRRKRTVLFLDLRRAQPFASQAGFSKLAKPIHKEANRVAFSEDKIKRFSTIAGRPYNTIGFCLTDADDKRWIPVVSLGKETYSGFHQGCGETALANLLQPEIRKHSLILIDELEASLHPRAQRRLVRELARMCRILECQIIVTTHSACILEEFPEEGRICVMDIGQERVVMAGVSPNFAMSQMDDEAHPEIDIYVEDVAAKTLIQEIIVRTNKDLMRCCAIVPYGSASVGRSLGQMVSEGRFPRPSIVFVDGDQQPTTKGCHLMPGGDAPEKALFRDLKKEGWPRVPERIDRERAEVVDRLEEAMTLPDHHEWVRHAATNLALNESDLWSALARAWANQCCPVNIQEEICEKIRWTIKGSPQVPLELVANPLPQKPQQVQPKNALEEAARGEEAGFERRKPSKALSGQQKFTF